MSLPHHHAALLGVVQGFTEFLPISSDGHLALAQALLGITHDNLTLSVTLHLGTLLATGVFFRQQVMQLVRQAVPLMRSLRAGEGNLLRYDLAVVILASLPTVVVGLALRESVERWTRAPFVVAMGFLMTAAALASTARLRRGKRETPSIRNTLFIGLAQGLAVLPGLSRSGSTIAVALHSGVKPERAFELSMLISLPAVFGALLLEAPNALHGDASLSVLAVGVACAFGVGLLALRWLRYWVVQGRFSLFALWVVPMALLTMASAKAWPIAP